ncbi:hypothetical protein HMPREF3232_00169 [Fannyhessea vaginae]|nr:hypothetical protein HMPREF3232_00169 [Fannyhessea vaginae]
MHACHIPTSYIARPHNLKEVCKACAQNFTTVNTSVLYNILDAIFTSFPQDKRILKSV